MLRLAFRFCIVFRHAGFGRHGIELFQECGNAAPLIAAESLDLFAGRTHYDRAGKAMYAVLLDEPRILPLRQLGQDILVAGAVDHHENVLLAGLS